MAIESVWKTTRKLTTHNAFFVTPDQRDAKLTETFHLFQRRLEVIAGSMRWRCSFSPAVLLELPCGVLLRPLHRAPMEPRVPSIMPIRVIRVRPSAPGDPESST